MQQNATEKEKTIGEDGYVNKNCWLACNVGRPPSKRCQYCELRFRNCMFEHYLLVTLILVASLLAASYIVERNISRFFIASVFALVLTYGYFFNKSTEKIIIAHFEEKKAKNAFKDLSDNLQQKVNEQTKDLKNAYDVEKKAHEQLKQLDTNKTQFMLVTQHHLRTPLAVNMGFLDLLKRGEFGKIPLKMNKVIKQLCDSTQKEIDIVNELLDVSSYQLGKEVVRLEPGSDIGIIIKEVVKELKSSADAKGIYLKCEKCDIAIPKVCLDKTKFKLALANIIDNCIKYTKDGGVTVSLKIVNDRLLIAVKDTGIGMSKELVANLFTQAFNRSQQAQEIHAVGKGIGLYLAGKIIESHKGKVWAESDGEGAGSVFYVELPIA